MFLTVITITIIKYVSSLETSPVVEIPQLGTIEGTFDASLGGRQFYSFQGIPYALPPIGKHRFKEAVPVKPWDGILKATTIYKCMQYYQYTKPGEDYVIGDEDCLYLNIYTPTLDKTANLDVIVYIHGGAFMFNYAAFQGPHFLLDRNIIFVTFNYRLGPLGFLSTADRVIPGNNGIKDQQLALQWIRDNIQHFGGNPQSITLAGMSAGGASVHLHYLSPRSRGLFHRGISQSGTALNHWVLMEQPLEKSRKLARIVGCDGRDVKRMVQCLRKRSAREIVGAVGEFLHWQYVPFTPFGPLVDTWAADPVLPQHPYSLLKQKLVADVPWIASCVESEGLYPAADYYANEVYLKELDERWSEISPHLLDFVHTLDEQHHQNISEKIRQYYLGDKRINRLTFMDLVRLLSARSFFSDIEKAVKLHAAAAATAPVYFYYFGYRGANSRSQFRAGTNEDFGATHGDDTAYVLKTPLDTLSTEEDRSVVKLFVDLFVEYAKNGKPEISTTEWPPVSKDANEPLHFLKIHNANNITIETGSIYPDAAFWQSLPIKENEKLLIKSNNPKEEL